MFKKKPKEKSRIKSVKVTTEIAEHICSSECFKKSNKLAPEGLKKISLGFIYQDTIGRFYHPWKDGDWLEITGVKFLSDSSGRLSLLFETSLLHCFVSLGENHHYSKFIRRISSIKRGSFRRLFHF